VKTQGLEGLVAKRRDSPYEPGLRSMRVNAGQELVIAGYTLSPKNFDAIVIGYYDGGRLLYAARTRNGFRPASRAELFKKPWAHTTQTFVGENTQGLFCDPLDRHLPNGWSFSLPNAVYRTTHGSAFDVQGIPPNVTAPVFADDDVVARKDPAMSMAIQILAANTSALRYLGIALRAAS
jgi:hypothetical protein